MLIAYENQFLQEGINQNIYDRFEKLSFQQINKNKHQNTRYLFIV